MKIVIAGGTGFIGQALIRHFLAKNYQLVVVGRNLAKIQQLFASKVIGITWDNFNQETFETLANVDLIINLAGANIAEKRWTEKRKKEILASRVKTSHILARWCSQKGEQSPPLFNASAVGIYGLTSLIGSGQTNWHRDPQNTHLPEPFSEETALDFEHPTDFVSKVARDWEAATWLARDNGVRVVNLRFGLVLDKKGLLSKLYPSFLLGLGGPIGTGRQLFPWVALTDLISSIDFLISHAAIQGPVNIVSSQCITQQQFAVAFAKVLHRPCFMKTPAFLVKLLFGEMGRELLLNGQCASPTVLLSNGFVFRYEDIYSALEHIFN